MPAAARCPRAVRRRSTNDSIQPGAVLGSGFFLWFAAPSAPRYSLVVAQFFKSNIGRNGRIARAIYGVLCIAGGVWALEWKLWVAIVLFLAGALGLIGAWRGWCLTRACGIKTRM